MIRYIISMFSLLPLISWASIQDERCADVGRYLQSITLSYFIQDAKISRTTVLEQKTKVEVIGVYPVSDVLANQLGEKNGKKQIL